jgi:CBS domain-containing protein
MGFARDILRTKNGIIISITPDITVYQALEYMVEKNVSALLVIEDDKLIGIFTEKDYARKVILKGKASKKALIREIMTTNPVTISRDTPIDDCMRLMTNQFVRHLTVIENNKVIGIISIGDVVKFIIDEQRYIIDNLEHYITGT